MLVADLGTGRESILSSKWHPLEWFGDGQMGVMPRIWNK